MNHYTNKKSLALLGHGKWKSALGHTLLLIGMVLMSMGAFAQAPTGGMYLHKDWEPNTDECPDGSCGYIRLETFVTGEKIITETHVPTDIVLVLDVSGSMADRLYDEVNTPDGGWTYNNYGTNTYYFLYNGTYYQVSRNTYTSWDWSTWSNITYYCLTFRMNNRTYYLTGNSYINQETGNTSQTGVIYTGVLYAQGQTKMEALKTSVKLFTQIIADDADEFDVDHRISIVKYASASYYNNSASSLTEGNHKGAGNNNNYNYTEVLINRRSALEDSIYIKQRVDELTSGGATASDYGMVKAQYLLASIPADDFEERNKVVVLFTDGAPTHASEYDATVANSTIANAYVIKNSGEVGSTNYTFNATVFSVGVFDNETTQIRTYMNNVSSNYRYAENMTTSGSQTGTTYYFKAESAGGLSDIFEAIANESGSSALPMGEETLVVDQISTSFQLNLPDGVTDPTGYIKAYAPKCIGKNGDNFIFEDEIDGDSRLEIGNMVINGQTVTGVVVGGDENRLPDNLIEYDSNDKTITFENFNFEAMYVAQEKDNQGTPLDVFIGRKLVILIPIEIGDGSWGDGIHTNGPLSLIYPDGDHSNPIYFNQPTANVLGSVWTEVVTTRPPTFPEVTSETQTIEISRPEELAWFISEVNGRIGYHENNNVASHPKLNAKLMADIDMSRHNWVPIGAGFKCNANGQYIDANGNVVPENTPNQRVKLEYQGTFDGNGHVITGLKNNASKYYKLIDDDVEGVVVFPGMFSTVSGTVKNVFVLDADFRGKHHNSHFVYHGIIADTLVSGGSIFNCEAAGRITCNNDDPTNDQQLIFGGLVGFNGGSIHSCMAMAELTAYTMGGMIGRNEGSFSNGFTNGVYNYIDNGVTGKYAGGIAAVNTGTIDNCYVRFERDNTNLTKMGTGFGMIYGSNTGTVTNYYTPQIVTWSRPDAQSNTTEVTTNLTVPLGTVLHPGDNPSNSYTLSISPSFFNMFTNDNMTGGSWGTLTNNGVTYNVYNNGTPLLTKLNANKGDGASWKRTSAGRYTATTDYVSGDINDDYPVLAFEKFAEGDNAPLVTCLGSADGIRIDYATSLNEMLHRHNNGNMNEKTQISNAYTQSNANYYKVTGKEAIYKGAINLYANDDVTLPTTGSKDGETVADNCTAEGVVVYIDEDISLLQDDNSSIEAYTGQTLKSFVRTQEKKERWHYVSSSLQNSEFGWTYGHDAQHTWDEDPCEIALEQEDEDHALFPIDLVTYKRFDFYCFYEPQYHWINFKRNSNSHFHMDNWDANTPISYTNEEQFTKGKGYLMAIQADYWHSNGKDAQFIQNRGTLTNGEFTIPVTYTAENEWTELAGYNLLGNPYQSYLDFTTFAWANEGLWDKAADMTFAVYDPKTDSYVQGVAGEQPSQGAMAASGDINMHQGFLIRIGKGKSGDASFNNTMRSNTAAEGTHFRGEQPAYPLINFILTDNNENTDIAVLELNRPENSGALKLRAGNPNGRIYFRHDNTNMAIFFRDNAEGHQSLNFAAEEDGNFTLSWNTANADFRTLTLVDNITGIKTDMLTHDHYTFEGRVDDYNTRFKIVFGEMDNNEEEPVLEHFAFFDHGNLIVNGTGHFEVVDVLGRVVYNAELTDTQNTISLPSNVRGVCMLCFTRNNETKVQKMVIQ